MALPFFYLQNFDEVVKSIILDEDTSRHIVQVLRMNDGEKLNLTDGKGNLLSAEITIAHKKHCEVNIVDLIFTPAESQKITIAISLIKNSNRFEWFLEKATEIGISEIIPLLCERTEKQKFRYDRMKQICISAMLQSQQTWLPVLHEPTEFDKLVVLDANNHQKFIAHCDESINKNRLSTFKPFNSSIILIGPEGDFSSEEIQIAIENKFEQVSLGNTRLRTETAGVVAASLLNMK